MLLDFSLLRYLLNSLNFEDESMKIISVYHQASSIYSIKFENLPFSMEGKVGEITQSKKKEKKKITARTSLNVVYMHINTCRVELVEIIRARYDGCFPGLGLRPTCQGVPCGRTIRPLWYCKYSQMTRSLKFPRAMNTISAMKIFCQIITDCYGKMSRQLL